jgi:predicted nucleic acid-binding Zn ribbon protein
VRRPAPRPLRIALEGVALAAAPPGLLPRVQGAWPGVAGPAVAAEAEPISEREGVVTVVCRSAVWAHELELLSAELLPRLNAELGDAAVRELRFTTTSRAVGSGRT